MYAKFICKHRKRLINYSRYARSIINEEVIKYVYHIWCKIMRRRPPGSKGIHTRNILSHDNIYVGLKKGSWIGTPCLYKMMLLTTFNFEHEGLWPMFVVSMLNELTRILKKTGAIGARVRKIRNIIDIVTTICKVRDVRKERLHTVLTGSNFID